MACPKVWPKLRIARIPDSRSFARSAGLTSAAGSVDLSHHCFPRFGFRSREPGILATEALGAAAIPGAPCSGSAAHRLDHRRGRDRGGGRGIPRPASATVAVGIPLGGLVGQGPRTGAYPARPSPVPAVDTRVVPRAGHSRSPEQRLPRKWFSDGQGHRDPGVGRGRLQRYRNRQSGLPGHECPPERPAWRQQGPP